MNLLRKITIISTLLLFTAQSALPANGSSPNAYSYNEERILNPNGQTIFRVHFYNYARPLSNDEKQEIKRGVEYWANVIKIFPHGKPATIAVQTTQKGSKYASVQDLIEVLSGALPSDKTADGILAIDNKDSHAYRGVRSHLPPVQKNNGDLYGTTVHELFHGFFDSDLKNAKGFFDLKNKTFGGSKAHNVNTVLEIDKPGADLQKIPLDENGDHSQLDRSVLSHHNYRNYSIPMEVELAALKDLGFLIDLRAWYGYSLYRSRQTIINENGYFARNAEGTTYLIGIPNPNPYGVGLHIYGSHNHLTQKANILTEGPRAVGARVDGVGNTLIIEKGTKVHANGPDGTGALFAYGKDHQFILKGELKAEGEQGTALAFDFGGNDLGSHYEERGSYFRSEEGKRIKPLLEHNGPLAKDVLINGFLIGKKQAIYMSKSGYVKNITITPEAHVWGNIVSDYNQKDSSGKPYLTSLIFGHEDPKENASGQRFIYTHNIRGKNIAAHFTGPNTALYGGQHELYSATVAEGATLSTDSTFTLATGQKFINAGSLSLTSYSDGLIGKMTIEGNYEQTDTGKLAINVLKNGSHDFLHVTKEAYLNGILDIYIEPDFYPNSWERKIVFLQADGGIEGDFSRKILPSSPTLRWNFAKNDHTYGLISPLKKTGSEAKSLNVQPVSNVGQPPYGEGTDGTFTADQPSERTQGVELSNTQEERPTGYMQSEEEAETVGPESHSGTTLALRKSKTTGTQHALLQKPLDKSTDQKINRKQDSPESVEATSDLLGRKAQQASAAIASETFGVIRPSNAYSQYATNVNEQSVGRVLDRVVDKADQPLKRLYEELDFSAPDGSEVRSALAQLSPVAYGGAFGVSLTREQQISDTLKERPSGILVPGQWQAFALPFVSQTNSKARDLKVGATMRTTGLIAGIEHHTSSSPGLTWGFHGVIGNKASLTFNTPDNARGSLQAWGVGIQLRYQPNLLAGPYLSAQARIGLEQGILTRTLSVNGYKGQQQAKWQGMTTTASVLGGHLWKVHDLLSLGPIVGIDYTTLTHPQITEKGSDGIRMTMEKNRYHSLQSSLGLRGIVSINKKLKVDLQSRWDRELLNTTLTQRARFANTPDSAFNTKTQIGPRDVLNVSAQVTYELSPTVTLGARTSAQFARSQKPDLIGNLSLNVKF